jgi:hypothetical protein
VYSTEDEDGVMLYCRTPACQQRERENESVKGEVVIDPKQQSREEWRFCVDALLGAISERRPRAWSAPEWAG